MEQAISKDVALVEAAKEAFADNDIFGGGQNEKMEQDEKEEEEEVRAVESMDKRLRLVFLR